MSKQYVRKYFYETDLNNFHYRRITDRSGKPKHSIGSGNGWTSILIGIERGSHFRGEDGRIYKSADAKKWSVAYRGMNSYFTMGGTIQCHPNYYGDNNGYK